MKKTVLENPSLENIKKELLHYGFVQIPICNISINCSDCKDQIEVRLVFETSTGELVQQNIFVWREQDLLSQQKLVGDNLKLIALFINVKTPFNKSLKIYD